MLRKTKKFYKLLLGEEQSPHHGSFGTKMLPNFHSCAVPDRFSRLTDDLGVDPGEGGCLSEEREPRGCLRRAAPGHIPQKHLGAGEAGALPGPSWCTRDPCPLEISPPPSWVVHHRCSSCGHLQTVFPGELPGGPVVRTRHFHRCSLGLAPGLGIEAPQQSAARQDQEKKKVPPVIPKFLKRISKAEPGNAVRDKNHRKKDLGVSSGILKCSGCRSSCCGSTGDEPTWCP